MSTCSRSRADLGEVCMLIFFQAEDGIRDDLVTGVQTCALPICEVDVNSSLEDPWGMGTGFAVQMVFIFIKNGSGGHTDTPPGVNARFAQGHEWNKLVVLSPQRKARVVGEATAKTGAMAKDIVVPNITRGSGRTIRGSVPLAELGGDGNVDAWGYQVVMQSNEGFPAEFGQGH